VHAQYRHFVVDEYQDVNPLQQRLLGAWLGDRRDLTVVGDASQTIYSFTGASSSYLLEFARTHRDAVVVRLVRDYRSTPQVVGVANAVIRQARGVEARLRLELVGQRPGGAAPELRSFDDEPSEAAAVAARCAQLIGGGVPARELAVLFRTNAQSQAYEEALAEASVPYVVHGAERFFDRPEIRQAVVALRSAEKSTPADTPLPIAVVAALEAVGWRPDRPPGGGAAREQWEALAALAGLAEEFARGAAPVAAGGPDVAGVDDGASGGPPARTLREFGVELARRALIQHAPTVDGVTLASLHSAKGLEWDAVFLVGLTEGTLPTTYAKTPEALEEERRLLYVGITRAREWLWMSYASARSPGSRQRRPSRFLPNADPAAGAQAQPRSARSAKPRAGAAARRPVVCRVCGSALFGGAERKLGRCASCPSDANEELYGRLLEWRERAARLARVPAYVVFTDATLTALAERQPVSVAALIDIAGIGPRKLGMYGEAVLALVTGASVDSLVPGGSDEE
jgi:DNA helicase-2/ATP-dependent DNA helicase PcrA